MCFCLVHTLYWGLGLHYRNPHCFSEMVQRSLHLGWLWSFQNVSESLTSTGHFPAPRRKNSSFHIIVLQVRNECMKSKLSIAAFAFCVCDAKYTQYLARVIVALHLRHQRKHDNHIQSPRSSPSSSSSFQKIRNGIRVAGFHHKPKLHYIILHQYRTLPKHVMRPSPKCKGLRRSLMRLEGHQHRQHRQHRDIKMSRTNQKGWASERSNLILETTTFGVAPKKHLKTLTICHCKLPVSRPPWPYPLDYDSSRCSKN